MDRVQIDTNWVCPHPEFSANAVGPITGEDPVDLGDPADASTADEFFRRIRARNPERYREVLKAHPVNSNVTRDELSHEVPLEQTRDRLYEWATPDGPEVIEFVGQSDPNGSTLVDSKAHRDWLEQQYR